MRYFVTGASGLLGRALTKELIESGHSVLGLARSEKSAQVIAALGADVHHGSLDNLESLRSGAAQSDGVAHLAFTHDFDGNFDFPAWCAIDRAAITALGEGLAGTNKPLVMTSGTLVLKKGVLGTEDDSYDKENPHAGLRGQSEELTLSLVGKGVKGMVIRPSPTNHGPEDHGFIPMMIAAAKEQGFSAYINDGKNVWPAVHRFDTAKLYALALTKGQGGHRYHAVAEEPIALKDIAQAIGDKLGLPSKSVTPEEAQKIFKNLTFAIMGDNPVSNKKTKSELGWEPRENTLLEDIKVLY